MGPDSESDRLALELIDPDAPGDTPAGSVRDVTPEAIAAFINDFLGHRLMSNDWARKRYVAATRSFVQWLAKTDLLAYYQAMKDWGLKREKRFIQEGWRKMRVSI